VELVVRAKCSREEEKDTRAHSASESRDAESVSSAHDSEISNTLRRELIRFFG
jgi:hypothetical protein